MATKWRDYPLATRLYLDRHLWELARFVGYAGKTLEEVEAFMTKHRAEHGETKARLSLLGLTMTDKASKRVVLRLDAKLACRVLLGPTPDAPDYAEYWRKRGDKPPEEERPSPKKRKRRTG